MDSFKIQAGRLLALLDTIKICQIVLKSRRASYFPSRILLAMGLKLHPSECATTARLPKITKSSSLALFVWLEKSQAFFIRMTRNVPKVIFSITIVEEYKPSGRFIWEAAFSPIYLSKNAILN